MGKQRKTPAPEGVVDIFSVLAEGDDAPKGGEEGGEEAKGGNTSALEAKIEAMEKELQRLERTNTALMAQSTSFVPQGPGPKGGETPKEPDFSGLPDPVTDAEAYHKEVAKRITSHLRGQLDTERAQAAEAAAQNQQRSAQVANLWSEFSEKHPDLAEHQDMVEFAAITVAQRARAKGLDVNRYMFQASDQYIQDVADEMQKRFGKALEVMGKDEGEGEGADEPSEHESMAAAVTAARTRGITGAIPGSGKAPEKPAAPEGGADDFIQDLHKVQRAMGII